MIDTIHINKRAFPEELFQDSIRKKWQKRKRKQKNEKKKKRDYYTINSTFGKRSAPITLKYDTVIRSLKIEFSLHKYLFGENYRNYNPLNKSTDILRKINDDLKKFLIVDINDFNVNRIDIGINIRTELETEYYLKAFDTLLHHKIGKLKKSWYVNETLLLRDGTTSIQIYDKIKELQARGVNLNSETHLLRIEIQTKNTQGMKAGHRFKKRLKFEEIFIPKNYCKLLVLLNDNVGELFPFNINIETTDTDSILEYIKNTFSKNYIIEILRLFKEFRNQTTTMSLIENILQERRGYSNSIKRKILQELKVLLISNSNLGYRKIVEEIYSKIFKEVNKQRKGVAVN